MGIRNRFKKPLQIYWWRYDYPSKLNFGDELTPLLIERLFYMESSWSVPEKAEIAGAGSILEILEQSSGENRINIWGSGYIKPGPKCKKNFNFLAVRGKYTLKRVGGDNVILGDPGILASRAFPEFKNIPKKYRVGIVPHYVDMKSKFLSKVKNSRDFTIIDVLGSPEDVIRSINECDLIFSSSLHGLIVGDSFGIPNYWMPFSDKLAGGDYKFKDYYSAYDEVPAPVNPQILMEKMDIENYIKKYEPKAQIEIIQSNLIASLEGLLDSKPSYSSIVKKIRTSAVSTLVRRLFDNVPNTVDTE